MKKFKLMRFFLFAMLILWLFLIFIFSSQNINESKELSFSIAEKVITIIDPNFQNLSETEKTGFINIIQNNIRKFAHLIIFFILGALCIAVIQAFKIKQLYKICISLSFCLIYAFSDEFHQSFISGRIASLLDICIDFTGSFIGVIFFITVRSILRLVNNILIK